MIKYRVYENLNDLLEGNDKFAKEGWTQNDGASSIHSIFSSLNISNILDSVRKSIKINDKDSIVIGYIEVDDITEYFIRFSDSKNNFENLSKSDELDSIMKLVRFTAPTLVRNKIFKEVPMETAADTIHYIRPVFSPLTE